MSCNPIGCGGVGGDLSCNGEEFVCGAVDLGAGGGGLDDAEVECAAAGESLLTKAPTAGLMSPLLSFSSSSLNSPAASMSGRGGAGKPFMLDEE